MEKLKPCPFCGGKPCITLVAKYHTHWHRIECDNRDCAVQPKTKAFIFEEEAREAWNSRTNDVDTKP